MALETLLGSCRRKHGSLRGKQGWVHISRRRLGCCAAFQYRICSPLTEKESEPDLHPSPSVVQPVPLTLSKFVLPPSPHNPHGLIGMLRNRLQVKPDHCFEQQKNILISSLQSFPSSLSYQDQLSNSLYFLLVNNNNANKQLFLTALHVSWLLCVPDILTSHIFDSELNRQQGRFDVKFYKNITDVSVPSHLQGEKLSKYQNYI